MLAVIVGVLAVVALVVLTSHLISGENEGRAGGIVGHLTRYIPHQSLKIVIVAWQILTQVGGGSNTVRDIHRTCWLPTSQIERKENSLILKLPV